METENLSEARRTQSRETQTDYRPQGQVPRLCQANLFTLLSLWMERFPRETSEDHDPVVCRPDHGLGVRPCGLVVVRGGRVRGLHVSGPLLHAGQEAVLRHGGAGLEGSQLYFSRRPCSACLKMVVNAGVIQVFFWPGDPEVSVLSGRGADRSPAPGPGVGPNPEALLDLGAVERLRAGGGPPVVVALRPLAPGLPQYVDLKARTSEFMERVQEDQPEQDRDELFRRQRRSHLQELSRAFLIPCEREHRAVLELLGLEAFCQDPDLSTLRSSMLQLVELLASVSAGLPLLHHGFYCAGEDASPRASTRPAWLSKESPDVAPRGPVPPPVSQAVARHCIIQATLLAFRTGEPSDLQRSKVMGLNPSHVRLCDPSLAPDRGSVSVSEDPKVGVGAVIWAQAELDGGDGTGRLYLVGCGYNAYPVGSQYAQYPQLDTKHPDRGRTKYRYIIHAEQNALTFRSEQGQNKVQTSSTEQNALTFRSEQGQNKVQTSSTEQNALTFRSREVCPGQRLLLFVTKCPCDECVPLIRAAGVTHVFTSDQDAGKDKGDISYLLFRGPIGPSRLTWQKRPLLSPSLTNGCVGKRRGSPSNQDHHDDKRLCLPDDPHLSIRTSTSPPSGPPPLHQDPHLSSIRTPTSPPSGPPPLHQDPHLSSIRTPTSPSGPPPLLHQDPHLSSIRTPTSPSGPPPLLHQDPHLSSIRTSTSPPSGPPPLLHQDPHLSIRTPPLTQDPHLSIRTPTSPPSGPPPLLHQDPHLSSIRTPTSPSGPPPLLHQDLHLSSPWWTFMKVELPLHLSSVS
ncbi:unnamed protein product [Boreogadus saida]